MKQYHNPAPDQTLTAAKEALTVFLKSAPQTFTMDAHGKSITAALDYATDLLIELNGDAIRIQDLTEENERLQSALSVTQEEGRTEIARLEAEIEKLKAERDALETENQLLGSAMDKIRINHSVEIREGSERRQILVAEITRLTSQLEQAETSALRHLSELVKISERLGGTSMPAPGYALGLVNQLAEELECPGPKGASQRIKDRQAKGDG